MRLTRAIRAALASMANASRAFGLVPALAALCFGAIPVAGAPLVAGEASGAVHSYTSDRVAVLAGIRIVQQAADTADTAADTTDVGAQAADARTTDPENPFGGFVSDFTDLGVRFRGRMEMGGEWTRFRPCDASLQASCDPGLFPQLRPDVQFGLDVGGSISDRIFVDVDYEETREFSATNNVNVFYQGMPGEFLQRLEVGDVSFELPRSRFLTEGIPAGNFGFRADARIGSMDLETVWAEQNGDVATRSLRVTGVGPDDAFIQDDTLVVDDADYVRGQFFFLVDPAELRGYPHVDALALTPGDAPPDVAPGVQPVQLYRFEADAVTRQQVEGYIQADAVAGGGPGDGEEVREAGWFRYLEPGIDYVVHSSGLWVALRRPLTRDEMLAVTYVTESGREVGTYDPERIYNLGGRPELQLLKASSANHRPGLPTWEREMHQVYRISNSSDVEPESVQLEISLGELSGGRTFKRAPNGRDLTFLRLFGLDEQAPLDELDRTVLWSPGRDYLVDQPPVSGVFLVFPTLEPFRAPPPLPSEGLTADETDLILGADANERIYTEPDDFERINGGLFRLNIRFRIRSFGGISSFSLGALGVRDGSERIYLEDRLLTRGIDYTIDYTIGQVVLLDPELLFAGRPDAELRVIFEQKQVFRLSPTSVFGMRGHFDLGERGGIDVLGLHQAEESLVNRPTLGVEPAAITLGGLNTDLSFDAGWLDGLVGAIPGLRAFDDPGADGGATDAGSASSIDFRGELALSLPNPNTRSDVYLDDFDGSNDRTLSLQSEDWTLGSAPQSRSGAESALPVALDAETSVDLVWQDQWIIASAQGDSVGVFEGFLPRQDIDRQINVVGSQRPEAGLLLTLGAGGEGLGGSSAATGQGQPGAPFDQTRWRSITTTLSPSGVDLTRSEFLEFYVAEGDSATLVLDLGVVGEDAFFVDSQGRVNGVNQASNIPWGLGILDQEANPARGEIWSSITDQRGVWAGECLAEPARIYAIGDERANCTRGNGIRDTEDLDEDGTLDTDERYLRFVVELGGSSPYLVRNRDETGTGFRLFRVPLRGMEGVPVGGFSPGVDMRSVENLRVTVASDRNSSVILTRMRLIGSRWVKRNLDGILEGIAGDDPGFGGQMEVSPVSRRTEGGAYNRPPGIIEELDDPTAGIVGEGIEFQEQSLSVAFDGLSSGDRAEVYNRYPQRPRDFLTYRQARIWAVARDGDWAPDEPVWFYLKVGSDSDNFYLYRRKVSPAPNAAGVQPQDWLPEVVVEMDEWLRLRQEAEELLARDGGGGSDSPGAGAALAGGARIAGEPLQVWSADSTYAVVLQDRGRAPNLAAVREVSLGVLNETGAPVTGEVWVNELRLTRGVEEVDEVGFGEMTVQAGDFATTRISYVNRGAFFQQLSARPSYQNDRDLRVSSVLEMDRFAPEGWALRAPVRVEHASVRRDPVFLRDSDIQASGIAGLRTPEDRQTRVSVSLRRDIPDEELAARRAEGGLAGLVETVASGMEIGGGVTRTSATTVTTEASSSGFDAYAAYAIDPVSRTVDLIPGGWDAELRWSPERISIRTSYFQRESETFRFQEIVRLPGDSAVRAIRSPRETLETTGHVALQPLDALGYDLDLLTLRDLLTPEEATGEAAIHPLIRAERSSWAGLDLGWETLRTLRTRLDFRPRIVDWLGTRLVATTYYGSLRDPNLVERAEGGGADGVGDAADAADVPTPVALQRNVNGQRDVRTSVSWDPGGMVEAVGGGGVLQRIFDAFEPLTHEWEDGITTRFNRRAVDPGGLLQMGWADEQEYRALGADTASFLVDRRSIRTGTGIRFPLSLVLRVSYQSSVSRSLDVRSTRTLDQETLPDITLRFESLPVPAGMQRWLSGITMGSGLRRTDQNLTYGPGASQLRREESVQVPVDVSLSWVGGLTTRYRGSFEEGRGKDPTGTLDRDRILHSASLSARFQPGWAWAENLERPIAVTLGWQLTNDRTCRVPAGRYECVPFVDQRNESAYLTVDTQIQRLEIGLQSSWVDRRSFVGQRQGSTQFQLGLFGQFQFTAGDLSRL